MIIPLLTWHPPTPETEAMWRRLGVRPLLTVDVDGLRHTISRDFAPRDGRLVAFDSDTSSRVYVLGHPDDDALDVALATPVARPNCRVYPWSAALLVDTDDGSDAPTITFGRTYEADGDELAKKELDEFHWVDETQSYYDLDSGYGPARVRNAVPPIEAIAGLIAAYMHGETEVDIEARPGYAEITIGALVIKAPPFRFGSGAESIPTLVARMSMTADKFEVEFLVEPKAAAYALGYNSAGFWHWFARAALAAGLRALFVSGSNPDTLTLLLDSRCCSGDDGPSWGCSTEPLVP